ncbi:MAG: DUF1592 domain-containing protein [Aureliella sp.]
MVFAEFSPSNSSLFSVRVLRVLASLGCVVILGRCSCLPLSAAEPSNEQNGFFEEHCLDCHSGDEAEGGLDLASLRYDLSEAKQFAVWERVFDRVEDGEMPPDGLPDSADSQGKQFLKRLGNALYTAHAKSKETVYRRLNRREYANTLNDLFGTHIDVEAMLPEDGRSHEFDNIGDALQVSMVQLERYMAAMDLVLDSSIAKTTVAPTPRRVVTNYAETREGKKHIGQAWGQADDGAVVFFRDLSYPTGMLRTANANGSGRYRIQIRGYAYQSDRPVTFAVGATTFQRGLEKPTFGYFAFTPGAPQTIELEAWLPDRYMVEISPWGISDDNYEIKKHGISAYRGPGLAINEVVLEGPLVDEFPSRGHRLLFEGLDRQEIEPSNPSLKEKPWYKPKFELPAQGTDGAADDSIRSSIRRVATVAFRRPVTSSEVQPFVDLFTSSISSGEDRESALRTAIVALFCAPEFLFLAESGDPDQIGGHAIAARLSYFLSRTTPDQELRVIAQQGGNQEDWASQVERLLADARFERFVNDFADSWLNLRDIDFTAPDKTLYPEFDSFLQFSMVAETRAFLLNAFRENVPIRELIQPRYAFLNNRLAKHYGIPGVSGPEIRKIAVPNDSVRGGLLGQASIHKVTANGTNTSPVVRGVWVTERILGKHVPPPPPGISGVEPDVRGASTLRELLAKHRDTVDCRSCHQLIDPPGFAMENFDPIGGYRERFRSLGEGDKVNLVINARKVRYRLGLPVDSSGQTVAGQAFTDIAEYVDLVASHPRQLAHTLVKKLLTFATGREMGFSDRTEIDAIVERTVADGYRVGDLLREVCSSPIFFHR